MRRRVLIVDDDESIREWCAEVFRNAGYAVTQAADGAEGLHLCRLNKPHLVILDLDMPVMNGWQFRAEQTQDESIARIPVLILSGQHQRLLDPVMRGVTRYVQKPFRMADLLALVESHIAAT
jgi:DNA-binding response OmpR family regulator